MSARHLAAAAIVFAVAAGASGCAKSTSASNSAPSASASTEAKIPAEKDLFDAFKKNTAAAKSGHVKGWVTEKGEKMQIELAGTADGSNSKVTVSAPSQGSYVFLTVDGKTWMQADAATWAKQGVTGAMGKRMAGKWVSVPKGSVPSDMTLGALLKEMTDNASFDSLDALNTNVDRTTMNGQAGYKLTQKVGGDGTVVVLSADGNAMLMQISMPKGKTPGELNFTEWNAVKPFTAPAAKDVVNLGG